MFKEFYQFIFFAADHNNVQKKGIAAYVVVEKKFEYRNVF